MDEQQVRVIADQLSQPKGEMAVSIGEKMNEVNAFISEQTISALQPSTGHSIVEIGPGNGTLSKSMVSALGVKGRYTGIELSAEMAIEASRQLGHGATCPVQIHTCGYDDAPIEPGTVDGVMAVNVLYFIEDLDHLFNRIAGWLKPGGLVAFGIRSEYALKAMPFTRYGFRIRPLETLIHALSRAGFMDVSVQYHDEGEGALGELTFPIDSLILRGVTSR